MEELELPLGEPFGMVCPGGLIFENAFSRLLPPSPTPDNDSLIDFVLASAAQTVEVLITQTAAVNTYALTLFFAPAITELPRVKRRGHTALASPSSQPST